MRYDAPDHEQSLGSSVDFTNALFASLGVAIALAEKHKHLLLIMGNNLMTKNRNKSDLGIF